MNQPISRRQFVQQVGVVAGALGLGTFSRAFAADANPLFKISLAEWSLHRTLFGGKMNHLDFPKVAKNEFQIDAIELVNQFFKDKAKDQAYLKDFKKRSEEEGVKLLLIMVDGEGSLGDPDKAKQKEAVENHHKWVDAAKFFGCHSIRVNADAKGQGSFEEQMNRAAEGLAMLSEYGKKQGLNVIVENHGGLSSHGGWLAGVMKKVNMPNCGTLPDFGNFNIGRGETYDRYKGVKEMMPFAKAVSAKSHDFDEQGNEIHTNYRKMMEIVLDAGYHGYVGIEYEGDKASEHEGIRLTKTLLENVRKELSKA